MSNPGGLYRAPKKERKPSKLCLSLDKVLQCLPFRCIYNWVKKSGQNFTFLDLPLHTYFGFQSAAMTLTFQTESITTTRCARIRVRQCNIAHTQLYKQQQQKQFHTQRKMTSCHCACAVEYTFVIYAFNMHTYLFGALPLRGSGSGLTTHRPKA